VLAWGEWGWALRGKIFGGIVYFSGQARGPVRTGGLRAGCVKKSSFFKKISKIFPSNSY